MNSVQSCTNASSTVRMLLGLAVLAALAAPTAHAGALSDKMKAKILQETPEACLVTDGQQLKLAEARAGEIPGAQAFFGAGSSMEPLYAPKTALVVSRVSFAALRAGMTVVYVNRQGRMLAHSLTGDLPGGWIAQGISNESEDDELVTVDNLVGVIVQAFAPSHLEARQILTALLVAKGKLHAAPARS